MSRLRKRADMYDKVVGNLLQSHCDLVAILLSLVFTFEPVQR